MLNTIKGAADKDISVMRLKINKQKDGFVQEFKHAYDDETRLVIDDFDKTVGALAPDVVEKLKSHILNDGLILVNDEPLDPKVNKNKNIIIESLELEGDKAKITGEIREGTITELVVSKAFQDRLTHFIDIDKEGKLSLKNLGKPKRLKTPQQSSSYITNVEYKTNEENKNTTGKQHREIMSLYKKVEHLYINDEKVAKEDVVDKILIFKNAKIENDHIFFQHAKFKENDKNYDDIASIIVDIFDEVDNDVELNQQLIWFKNEEDTQLSTISKSRTKKIGDTLRVNRDGVFVHIDHIVDRNNTKPIYVVNNEIVEYDTFAASNPLHIQSITLIKTYDELSEELKSNPFIKKENFPGVISIQQNKNADANRNPIYVINGQIVIQDISHIKPNQIASIRAETNFDKLEDHLQANPLIDKNKHDVVVFIELKEDWRKRANKEVYKKGISYGKQISYEDVVSSLADKNPPVIVNGKIMSSKGMDKIEPKDIRFISVITDIDELPEELIKQVDFKQRKKRIIIMELKDEADADNEELKEKIKQELKRTKFVYADGKKLMKEELLGNALAFDKIEFNNGRITFTDTDLYDDIEEENFDRVMTKIILYGKKLRNRELIWFETEDSLHYQKRMFPKKE